VSSLGPEALLAAAYAAILVGSAYALDALARHSQRRSETYGTGRFRFHPHIDAWECPEGELLHLARTDEERRLVRYRARPLVCNSCPAKPECTDSDEGREIVRSLDTWPHSEVGRFHRVVSLSLVALAGLVAALALVRNHEPAEALLLCGVIVCAALAARSLAAELRQRPGDGHAVA
jgi:hypothetical protein